MSSIEEAWDLIRQTVDEWCCCASTEFGHKKFSRNSTVENGSFEAPGSIKFIASEGITNPIFETDNYPPIPHTPPHKSKRIFRFKFHLNTKKFTDITHTHESSTDPEVTITRDSVTTRESGYGKSIDGGSVHSQFTVTVTKEGSMTYKIGIQDQHKGWFTFRRQPDFLRLQELLVHEGRLIGPKVPLIGKARARELNVFLQNVANDSSVMQLQFVRNFFILDRVQAHTSTLKFNEEVPTQPQDSPNTQISDRNPELPPPIPPRKNVPKITKSQTNCDNSCIPISNVPLGCDEKKMSPSDFDFLSVIGKGSFGKVMMAKKKDDGRIYAVKMLNKRMILRRNETAHVLSERSVLIRVLKHPYVVQLHFAFTSTNKIFFVLDYVNGGELFYHLQNERTFSESRTRFYSAEICCALTYMHLKGIVYRDLKPENILLDREGHVVLTDFGLCKEGLEDASARTATFCGTPEYLAPEIILKLPYTRSIDWWTFGAVIYEMLFGLPPFYSKDTTVMYHAIIKKPVKLRSGISPAAKDLILRLLHKLPSGRLGSGAHDGCEVQAHEFFNSIDWDKIESREIKPSFVPKVKGDDDLSNIDKMFTKEPVNKKSTIAPAGQGTSVASDSDSAFRGFSYVQPKDHLEPNR